MLPVEPAVGWNEPLEPIPLESPQRCWRVLLELSSLHAVRVLVKNCLPVIQCRSCPCPSRTYGQRGLAKCEFGTGRQGIPPENAGFDRLLFWNLRRLGPQGFLPRITPSCSLFSTVLVCFAVAKRFVTSRSGCAGLVNRSLSFTTKAASKRKHCRISAQYARECVVGS